MALGSTVRATEERAAALDPTLRLLVSIAATGLVLIVLETLSVAIRPFLEAAFVAVIVPSPGSATA